MSRPDSTTPAAPVLVAAMAVAVLAGAPLVYLLWGSANELLTGNVGDIDVVTTLVAAAVFAVLLWVLGRSVMRFVGEEGSRVEPRPSSPSTPEAP